MLLGFCVEHGAEKEGHRGQWRRWRNHYLRVFQCAVLSVEAHGAIVVDDVFELAPADIGARVVGTATTLGSFHLQPTRSFQFELDQQVLQIGLLCTEYT